MITPTTTYKFAEFTFNPARRKLFRGDEEISLIDRDFETLRFLIENRPQSLSKDQIMKFVWGDTTVDENSIEKAIGSLRKLLQDSSSNSRFIKTVTRKGYAFIHDVDETTENVISPNSIKEPLKQSFGNHSAYILICSLLYGLLFWIALLLEVAYQFDRFGTTALWLGFPVVFWIAAASFLGLTRTENLIRQKRRSAFFTGLAFFVGGTILLCLAASYFLPDAPVTLARFQTQPAFAAYFKNSFAYFLPLGIGFILIPFYLVCVRQSGENDWFFWSKGAYSLRPSHLFGVLLSAFIFSVFSGFYLSDNLQPGTYHSLFVILLVLRLLIYFSLGVICLLWYNSHQPPETVAPIKWNYHLDLLIPLPILLSVVSVAAMFFSTSNEERIKQVVKDSQTYESLVLYENPASFDERDLKKYWIDEQNIGDSDRAKIRTGVKNLIQKGIYYGKESKCEKFDFVSVEVNEAKDFAVVKTIEKWLVAKHRGSDGSLLENKAIGPYSIIYNMRKIDGKWLIEKSSTPRADGYAANAGK